MTASEASVTPLISAHRGGRQEAPENTLDAFRKAADNGIPGAECDLHLSADGVPVVIHDATVDRTTNGTGEVHELTVEKLAALDARADFVDWPTRPRVPTFAELMEIATSIDYMEVEIKPDAPERIERLLPRVIEEIDRVKAREMIRFISFDPDIVAACHRLAPDISLSLLTLQTTPKEIQDALRLGCDGIAGDVRTLTQEFTDMAHHEGLKVTCWTVNSDEDFDNMVAWGVDVVTTDRPTHMRDRLKSMRSR
ncbi:MAG TPA: glycerophosphodiester phosphodiesterase family protein [Thermomicrobiales bacterium]|nr:glycerophosphodiester phosphodiesterase family protein [Thermomicrobiales bacterium]